MKTVSFKVPTFSDARQATKATRTSLSAQLTRLAKRIEPKPKPAKAKKVAK